jgi:hypothetical protein
MKKYIIYYNEIVSVEIDGFHLAICETSGNSLIADEKGVIIAVVPKEYLVFEIK